MAPTQNLGRLRACPERSRTGQWPLPALSPLAQQCDRASLAHHPFEAEWFYRLVTDVRDCFIDRIGRVDQFEIGGSDHSSLRHNFDEMEQFFPIIGSHDHNGKVFDLPGLSQSQRFEELVECACAAGHDNEGIGIFYEESFAGEKVMHPHAAIEIRVRWLLRW